MYGFIFNAIKLGFYSDYEKRSWYIICTGASVPEDYDDYIDYEDQLFLELAVGEILGTLKFIMVGMQGRKRAIRSYFMQGIANRLQSLN